MISFLRGRVLNKINNYIIIDVHDLGYQVFVREKLLNELQINKEVELYIYHRVKEDSNDLYGFSSVEELELFELLLSVSGVGPKSALGVLSVANINDIKESIVQGRADLLTKVSGIGKKTAERVVLELRNKMGKLSVQTESGFSSLAGDEIDALMSLGYSLSEAREALNSVDSSITDSGKRVKEALKRIKG